MKIRRVAGFVEQGGAGKEGAERGTRDATRDARRDARRAAPRGHNAPALRSTHVAQSSFAARRSSLVSQMDMVSSRSRPSFEVGGVEPFTRARSRRPSKDAPDDAHPKQLSQNANQTPTKEWSHFPESKAGGCARVTATSTFLTRRRLCRIAAHRIAVSFSSRIRSRISMRSR